MKGILFEHDAAIAAAREARKTGALTVDARLAEPTGVVTSATVKWIAVGEDAGFSASGVISRAFDDLGVFAFSADTRLALAGISAVSAMFL